MFNFYESINEQTATKLYNISFSDFKDIYEQENGTISKQGDKIWIHKSFKEMKKYLKLHINNGFKSLKREYKYSKNSKDCGRIFVEDCGIQRIPNFIRGVLVNGLYNDFDMNNAHPVILVKLCKDNNIRCRELENYVDKRDEMLKSMISQYNINRNQAKVLFIKSINSNEEVKLKNRPITNRDFKAFDEEMKQIQKKFLELNKDLEKKLKYNGVYENMEGKLLNNLLCNEENKILNNVINKVNEHFKNMVVSVPMFDGFLAKTEFDEDKIIEIANETSKEYNIKWSIKPHNIKYYYEIINLDINKNTITHIANDFSEMAKYLNKYHLDEKLICCNNELFFKQDNNLFTSHEKSIHRALLKFLMYQDLYLIDNNKQPYKISGDPSLLEKLIKSIMADITVNNNFINEMFENTKQKIFFNNGYYDFEQNKFIDSLKGVNTAIIINRDFNNESNSSIRKDIFDKVFYPIFGIRSKDSNEYKLLEYYLHTLARAVAGHYDDKRWLLFEGLRNSGKGVLSDLITHTFGDYVQATNSDNFISKKSGADAQKALSWLLDYEFRRIMLVNEVKKGKNVKIDDAIIKKITSGGDQMNARKNFANEKKFNIQSTLIMCCNTIPEFTENDCMETCDYYTMKSNFLTPDKYYDNEYLRMGNINYYLADNNIKKFIKQDEVINEFVLILIDYYNNPNNKYSYPKEIKDETNDTNENINDDLKKLFSYFEFTNNKDDFISSAELNEFVEDKKLDEIFNIREIRKHLKNNGAVNKTVKNVRGYIKIMFRR